MKFIINKINKLCCVSIVLGVSLFAGACSKKPNVDSSQQISNTDIAEAKNSLDALPEEIKLSYEEANANSTLQAGAELIDENMMPPITNETVPTNEAKQTLSYEEFEALEDVKENFQPPPENVDIGL